MDDTKRILRDISTYEEKKFWFRQIEELNNYVPYIKQNLNIDLSTMSEGEAYIYIIKSKNTCKIGLTTKPKKRMTALQISTPKKEKEIHAKLKEHRIKGEWFKYSKDIVRTVKDILE